jgi:hypothetical protein
VVITTRSLAPSCERNPRAGEDATMRNRNCETQCSYFPSKTLP